jgi:hypothetical protein
MHIWIASIAAVIVQPFVFAARLMPDFIAATGHLNGLGFVLLSAVAVATLAILILGLPTFVLLRKFQRDSWTSVATAGIVLGAMPAAVLWPRHLEGYSAGQNWHGTYVNTYVNGAPTSSAWLMYGEGIFYFALHGLAGALVFYAVWRKLERSNVTIDADVQARRR